MVFFFLFLRNMLCGVWAECKTDPVVCKKNKQRVRVVVKMFFVMGVSWIAEIISFFLNWFIGPHLTHKYLLIFQLINSLQVSVRNKNWSIICFVENFLIYFWKFPGIYHVLCHLFWNNSNQKDLELVERKSHNCNGNNRKHQQVIRVRTKLK